MDQRNDYNDKAFTCFKQVRRIFIFTFVFVLVSMVTMYGTTEKFSFTRTMSFISLSNITVINITRESVAKLAKSLTSESVNKLANLRTSVFKGMLRVEGRDNTTGNLSGPSVASQEFPWMPDPCSEPRRLNGVEDLLCMKPPQFLPNFKNPCWKIDGKLRCIPYFQLFGICKSGTSDFFKRLYLHPDIVPNRGIFGKEIWYWSWKRMQPKRRGGLVYLGMTFEEFTRQFQANLIEQAVTNDGYHTKITGMGDPMDFWDEFNWKSIPQNDEKASEPTWTTPFFVHHMNPNVKLILMLRDPVERLFSHYLHSGAGSSAAQFDQAIKLSVPRWKECVSNYTRRQCVYDPDFRKTLTAPIYTSFYNIHLQEWLRVFPREQIFIFRNEDYTKDIKGTFRKLFKFLEIDDPPESTLDAIESLPNFYATVKKQTAGQVKQETRDLLLELYRPHMEELANMLKDDRFLWKDGSFS